MNDGSSPEPGVESKDQETPNFLAGGLASQLGLSVKKNDDNIEQNTSMNKNDSFNVTSIVNMADDP